MTNDKNAEIHDLVALHYQIEELFQEAWFVYDTMQIIPLPDPELVRISILIKDIPRDDYCRTTYVELIKKILGKEFLDKRLMRATTDYKYKKDDTVVLIVDMKFRINQLTTPLRKQLRICVMDGCENTFVPKGHDHKYCSRECYHKTLRGQ